MTGWFPKCLVSTVNKTRHDFQPHSSSVLSEMSFQGLPCAVSHAQASACVQALHAGIQSNRALFFISAPSSGSIHVVLLSSTALEDKYISFNSPNIGTGLITHLCSSSVLTTLFLFLLRVSLFFLLCVLPQFSKSLYRLLLSLFIILKSFSVSLHIDFNVLC